MSEKITVSLPLFGQCQCGAIKYQSNDMPLTLYACHCTECQKQSSSGFGMSMPVPKDGFKIIRGSPAHWNRISESGRTVKCGYCSKCGTRIYHMPFRNKSIINIKPGTLNDTKWLDPVGYLWVSSAQKAFIAPDNKLCFSHQPENFDSLFEAWSINFKELL